MRCFNGCDSPDSPAATFPPAQPTRPWRYNSGFSGPHDVAARYARGTRGF